MLRQKMLIANTKTATIEKAIKASEIVVDAQKAVLSQFWDIKQLDYKLYIPFQIIVGKALINRYSQSGDKKHLNLANRTNAIVKALFGDTYNDDTIKLVIADYNKQLNKLYRNRIEKALANGKNYIWLSSTTSLTNLFSKCLKRYCSNLNSNTVVDTTDIIHSIIEKSLAFGIPKSEIEKAANFVSNSFRADYKAFKDYYNSSFATVKTFNKDNTSRKTATGSYKPYLIKGNKVYSVNDKNAIVKVVKNLKLHSFKRNFLGTVFPTTFKIASGNTKDIINVNGDKISIKCFLSVYDLFYQFANQAIANERRYKATYGEKGINKEFVSLDSLKENGFDIGRTNATVTDKFFVKEFATLVVDTLQWYNVKKETARKFVKAFVLVNYIGTDIKDTCKQVGISWNSYYRLKAILENDSNIILTYR